MYRETDGSRNVFKGWIARWIDKEHPILELAAESQEVRTE